MRVVVEGLDFGRVFFFFYIFVSSCRMGEGMVGD